MWQLMKPCKYCGEPIAHDDYPSIPAHVLCCLRWLDDKAEKERQSCSECLKPFSEENPQALHERDQTLLNRCEECTEARRLRLEKRRIRDKAGRIKRKEREEKEEKLYKAEMEELRQIASQRINRFY